MNELKTLRLEKNIPAKDMVEVVRRLYPKYDKTIQSKCENSELYAVVLAYDAMDALYAAFGSLPETPLKACRSDARRLTCPIRAGLEKPVYDALQQRIKAEGYDTVQEWLTDKVIMYLDAYGDLDKEGEP